MSITSEPDGSQLEQSTDRIKNLLMSREGHMLEEPKVSDGRIQMASTREVAMLR